MNNAWERQKDLFSNNAIAHASPLDSNKNDCVGDIIPHPFRVLIHKSGSNYSNDIKDEVIFLTSNRIIAYSYPLNVYAEIVNSFNIQAENVGDKYSSKTQLKSLILYTYARLHQIPIKCMIMKHA